MLTLFRIKELVSLKVYLFDISFHQRWLQLLEIDIAALDKLGRAIVVYLGKP
jgi:hypothetical protein